MHCQPVFVLAGGPPLTMSLCTIPTEGAPSLRFLQGWAAILRVLFCLLYRTAWTAPTAARERVEPPAQAFPTPALRKEREGRGTHYVADAGEIKSLGTRRFAPPTTDSRHGWRIWPNLARGLVTRNLNELWVADITYVRLQEEFAYVAVVLDAHSRRVIGWAVAGHLGASLAVEALRMALSERQPAPGLIHHSDRGIQYACADYLTLLAEHGAQPSMSRVGNPYDNAKAESFMKTLKEEQVRHHQWRDLNALRADLSRFLQITYNHQRLHSSLDYQTPAAFEQQFSS